MFGLLAKIIQLQISRVKEVCRTFVLLLMFHSNGKETSFFMQHCAMINIFATTLPNGLTVLRIFLNWFTRVWNNCSEWKFYFALLLEPQIWLFHVVVLQRVRHTVALKRVPFVQRDHFPFSTNQVVGCAKMHATRASRSFFLFQPIALSLLIVLKCVPHVLHDYFSSFNQSHCWSC